MSLSADQDKVFLTSAADKLPKPPIFKRGFNGTCFTVPAYYAFSHSETQWLINMYRSESWTRLEKIALLNPEYYRTSYFQIPDNPSLTNGHSMFHRKCIAYLTAIGLAIYLRVPNILEKLLTFRLSDGSQLIDPRQPCFVTNVFVKSGEYINDLMQIPPFCILILRESFDCIHPMLKYGDWKPLTGFTFFYRRPFKICRFVYKDIVEYSLAQLVTRTSLRLPHFFNCLINCFNEEFSLQYYEQVRVMYVCKEIEEWISTPRRLLRFGYYFDKELRLTSQIVRSILIFQQHTFFFGPCQNCHEIIYSDRIKLLKCNFQYKVIDSETARVLLDQDNCIALLLGMLHVAHKYHHNMVKDKILNVLPSLLYDTKWLLHFIVKTPCEICNYFENLVEKIGDLPEVIILFIRKEILNQLMSEVIPIYSIRELNIKPTEEVDIREVLDDFADQSQYLGKSGSRHPGKNRCNSVKLHIDDTVISDDSIRFTEPYSANKITNEVVELLQEGY